MPDPGWESGLDVRVRLAEFGEPVSWPGAPLAVSADGDVLMTVATSEGEARLVLQPEEALTLAGMLRKYGRAGRRRRRWSTAPGG